MGKDEVMALQEQMLGIVKEELIPLISMGVCSGFIWGTLFSLAAYGIFKAISLLGIRNTIN